MNTNTTRSLQGVITAKFKVAPTPAIVSPSELPENVFKNFCVEVVVWRVHVCARVYEV